MKHCNKCLQLLPDEAFHKRTYKNGKDVLQPTCKDCKKIISRDRYERKKEHILKVNEEWRISNPEQMKRIRQDWWKDNPKMGAYYQALYRAKQEGTLPKWITDKELDAIKQIYLERPDGYHVDHIVPLHGKTVQGLHVVGNLQYLTAMENCSKSNKLTV